MKILRLATRFGLAGGTQSYTFQLGRALAQRGHEFHVLSCTPHGPDDDYIDDGIHVYRRTGPRWLPQRDPIAMRWTWIHLFQILAHRYEYRRLTSSFDVIESPEFRAIGLPLAVNLTRPLVVRLHSPLILEAPTYSEVNQLDVRISDWLERRLVTRATILTAATPWMADQLRARGWLGDREVRVVRNPIDIPFWAVAPPVAETEPVVLAVGRLERRKAPDVLIRAVARLKRAVPNVRVVFHGKSSGFHEGEPYRQWLTRLAAELDVRCEFSDVVARNSDAYRHIYDRARVVAVPSWQEGFSNAGMEGLAAGRPLVCTSSTGISTLIAQTDAGQVVPPGDDAALARALKPYLRSADRAAAAGACGQELARAECDPAKVAAQAEDCYCEAVGRFGRAGASARPGPAAD